MENRLAENIRSYRKKLGLSQEQLAERLGITLGTVSKWERGASEPDLMYIMEIAELFHVSVDVLIGYTMRGSNADEEQERIKKLVNEKSVQEATPEYDNALMKFPNHFGIVYDAAECYKQIGTVYRKEAELRKSIELYRHAIDLIGQNRDPEVSEISIRNDIAGSYSTLKEYDKAVKEFEKNNVCGNNDPDIGLIMIQHLKKPDEGMKYSERAFINKLSEMVTIMSGFILYYRDKKNLKRGMRAAGWTIQYLESMKDEPEKACYLDKIISLYHLTLGIMQSANGQDREAEESLRLAVRMARDFDENPVTSLGNIVFADHVVTGYVYDNSGATAMDGLKHVMEEEGEYAGKAFRSMFAELVSEIENA